MALDTKISVRVDESTEAKIRKEAAKQPRMTPSDWIREQIEAGLKRAAKVTK